LLVFQNAPKVIADGMVEEFEGHYYVTSLHTYHKFRTYPDYPWLKA